MKKILFISLFLFLIFNVYTQNKYVFYLTLDGEKQILDNNFKIFFVHISDNGKIVYTPEIRKDTIVVPYEISLLNMSFYWIVKYKHRTYLMDKFRLVFDIVDWKDLRFDFASSSTYKSSDGYWYSNSNGWLSKKDSLKGCLTTSHAYHSTSLIFDMKKYHKLCRLLLRKPLKNDAKLNERIATLEKEYQ